MYRHWRVNRMTRKARLLTRRSVPRAARAIRPAAGRLARARAGEAGRPRAAGTVCDYIAGMTDRYAMDEHRRLTDLTVSWLRNETAMSHDLFAAACAVTYRMRCARPCPTCRTTLCARGA